MQTTLRLHDDIHRHAKAEAARLGVTLTQFIEDAIRAKVAGRTSIAANRQAEVDQRNQMMKALLRKTAHFRKGPKPTRDEMNERPGLR